MITGSLQTALSTMSIFRDPCGEIKLKVEIYKQLAEGCKRHPAYRAKRKPTAPCKQCDVLWDLSLKIAEYDVELKRYHRAQLDASIKHSREESERFERYSNSHQ